MHLKNILFKTESIIFTRLPGKPMAQNKRTPSLDDIWTHVVCMLWVGYSKVEAEPRAKPRDRWSQEGVVT